jgi:hypothetical protein
MPYSPSGETRQLQIVGAHLSPMLVGAVLRSAGKSASLPLGNPIPWTMRTVVAGSDFNCRATALNCIRSNSGKSPMRLRGLPKFGVSEDTDGLPWSANLAT